MKKFVKILSLCILSFCFLTSFSFAQEAEDTATEAEMYFASGSVAEVTATQIGISEYDFDAGQEIKVSYEINAQTQFEGATTASEIKAGDDVEIEYQTVGDKKIATRIEKYAAEDIENPEEALPVTEEVANSEKTLPAVGTKNEELLNEETQEQLKEEGSETETNF